MNKKIITSIIIGLLSTGIMAVEDNSNTNAEMDVNSIQNLEVSDVASKLESTITASGAEMAKQKVAGLHVDFNRPAGFKITVDSSNNFILKRDGGSTDDDIPYTIECVETGGFKGHASGGVNQYSLADSHNTNGASCIESTLFKQAASDVTYDVNLTISEVSDLRAALEAIAANGGYRDDITVTLHDKTVQGGGEEGGGEPAPEPNPEP